MLDCNGMGCASYNGASASCVCFVATRVGEPEAGNLHVRFEEGERRNAAPYSTVLPSCLRAYGSARAMSSAGRAAAETATTMYCLLFTM